MNSRFTIDGDEALEARIAEICEDTKAGLCSLLPKNVLRGIALGGGYGRGEGGVLRSAGIDEPYNDVEFFVFAKGQKHLLRRKWAAAIDAIGHRLTAKHGIEVEMRLLGSAEVKRATPSMFYFDLLKGHYWVLGDSSLFAGCGHHSDKKNLPLSEATRLLMNRSSGLLFSKSRLEQKNFSEEDADFVFRNISKAQLALGDAILASQKRYHWSCRERHERLKEMNLDESILLHHADGVAFKLHPFRSTHSKAHLTELHRRLSQEILSVFLEIESRRLNVRLTAPEAYLLSSPKCPESPKIRNRFINLRDKGIKGLSDTRHPRERLLNRLCDSLWCRPGIPLGSQETENFTALWHAHG